MTGPTVLVVLSTTEDVEACLRAGADAAAALPSPRIEVLHIRLDPAGSLVFPEVLTSRYEQAIRQRSAGESTAIRAAFDEWQAGPNPANATWAEVEAVPATTIRERGALAALVVVARPSPATHPADLAGFDAAVFDTGKPTLVVPPGAGRPFGHHLALGWRDVPATRRALAALRPWLMAARTVSVIGVGDHAQAPPADWMAANLPADGSFHPVAAAGRSDGEALLHAAGELGADGVAIGAYRHGRLVERLMGGVTADALRDAPIPVLMQV